MDDVQRYISRPGGEKYTDSPDSDYSDDLLSPKVLPDFRRSLTPMRSIREDAAPNGGMRRRILEELDDDGLENGMSKLQIGKEKVGCDELDGLQESDDDSVMLVTTKPFKRRVLDDEDSSVESDNDSNNGDNSDANVNEINSNRASTGSNLMNDQNEANDFEVELGDAFSELVLNADDKEANDANQSIDNESGSCANSKVYIETINSDDEDDDIIQEIEGCGCWTIDKETKDLHLPMESGKWPRIRLPFTTYQKLYQHQRIGIQWMASLHRNTIKGGILADDMGMVSDEDVT